MFSSDLQKTATDRDIDYIGNVVVKHSFWLNKCFLQKLIREIGRASCRERV